MNEASFIAAVLRIVSEFPEGIGLQAIDRRMIARFSPNEVSGHLQRICIELVRIAWLEEKRHDLFILTPAGREHLRAEKDRRGSFL